MPLDIDVPELPSLALRIPGFSLPALPSLPAFSMDLDIDPPELPTFAIRIPGFSLPALPQLPTLTVPCPFD